MSTRLSFVLSLTIAVLFATSGASQGTYTTVDDLSKKERKAYATAKKLSRQGQTTKAIKVLQKLSKKQPDLHEGLLSLGGLYYREQDYAAAASYLERALAYTPDTQPDIQYSLATIYRETKAYATAARYYDDYLRLADSTEVKVPRARRYAADMHFAAEATANPVPFHPVAIQGGINTVYSEYMPLLRGDGQEMIFIRRWKNQEDLYSAMLQTDSTYGEAIPLTTLNTKGNEGIHTLSADGNLLVFTACERQGGYGLCDLYYSRRVDGEWTAAINMGPRVNSASSDSGPSLTADGRGLYFMSDRVGSLGARDIWYTQLQADGKWHLPVNLGDVINTRGNEESPFIHQDGVTLYYRSNGLPGMGDYDIYYSKWDKEWSPPTNIGYPINTEGSEGALSVSLDGTKAYYASDRSDLESSTKDLDIYTFEMPAHARPRQVTYVKGRITDSQTGEPIAAMLTLEDHSTSNIAYSAQANSNGEYFVTLPVGYQYALTAEEPGYLFYSEYYDLLKVGSIDKPYQLDIQLTPIANNTDTVAPSEVVLRNVFFDTGSAELLPASTAEINRLAALLVSHPSSSMTITGHTDNVGQPEENLRLSTARATAVKAAILASGIDVERIDAVGQGDTQPIASNETPDGRATNRRVAFVWKP